MEHLRRKVLDHQDLLITNIDSTTGALKVINDKQVHSCGFNDNTLLMKKSLDKILGAKHYIYESEVFRAYYAE